MPGFEQSERKAAVFLGSLNLQPHMHVYIDNIYMHIYTHIYIHICIYIYTYIHIHRYTHTSIYIYVYTHIYIYMYTYAYGPSQQPVLPSRPQAAGSYDLSPSLNQPKAA